MTTRRRETPLAFWRIARPATIRDASLAGAILALQSCLHVSLAPGAKWRAIAGALTPLFCFSR
jgi:hypothetical protein